jgi:hypothetical protein
MAIWGRKDRRPRLTRQEALSCRPVKRAGVGERRLGSGGVVLVYPVSLKPWMAELLRRFQGNAPPAQTRKLELDELGTSVWSLIDGRRTVLEIVDAFAGTYRLHRREAEVSVTRFLYELGRRGLVAMEAEKASGRGG